MHRAGRCVFFYYKTQEDNIDRYERCGSINTKEEKCIEFAVTEGTIMKYKRNMILIGIIAAVVMALLCCGVSAETASGTCGDNLTWVLDENGVLTISGEGDMTSHPWDAEDVIEVVIEDGVTSIDSDAFYCCTNLTSITIPEGITSIGADAFWNCTSLTSIIIPEGVTSIGGQAFCSCSSLTNITIPDSVTSIGDLAFLNCISLTSIDTGEDNDYYSSTNGILYNKDKTSLIAYPAGRNGDYVIPGSVTNISDYAFYNCMNLTGITIPESITSIGNLAFYYCTSLMSVSIPSSVTSIGEFAFSNCTGLTSIMIPENVTCISSNAFSLCTSLTSVTIPSSVTFIDDFAFSGCENLTSITIPDSVTSIGDYAFQNCYSLRSAIIPSSVNAIGLNVFWNCINLENITIQNGANSIGDSAFYCCTSLKSITIPESVTEIGNDAFSCCYALTDVYYSGTEEQWNLISIGSGNEYLTNAAIHLDVISGACEDNLIWVLEDGVLTISGSGNMTDYSLETENEAETVNTPWYSLRTSITSVIIRNGVTGIGKYAFCSCQNVTNATIPGNVTDICTGAFRDCSSLTDIYYKGTEERWNTITIYSDNDCLTDAEIHYGVVLESDHPYEDDEDQTWTYTHPTEAAWMKVTFSDDTETEDYYDLIYLTDETGNTREYSGRALAGQEIYLQGQSFSIRLTSDGSATCYGFVITSVVGFTESEYQEYLNAPIDTGIFGDNLTWEMSRSGVLTISGTGEMPDFYEGAPWSNYKDQIITVCIGDGITYIGYDAFNNCTNLRNVTIPSSTTSIWLAFMSCESLTEIVIPDGVINIGYQAFMSCWNLTSVTIPDSVTNIDANAFFDCTSLEHISVPASVTNIGKSAFSYCPNLMSIDVDENNAYYCSENGIVFNKDKTTIIACPGEFTGSYTIPDSVTSIADSAFEGCRNLTDTVIPDGVISIGKSAFNSCTSMRNITIPESVTSIGEDAFSACWSMTNMIIPSGVTSIENYTFIACNSMTGITIPNSITSIGENAFYSCTALTDIYYTGTEGQWNAVSIDIGNDCLTNAVTHFSVTNGTCGDNLTWALDDRGMLSISGSGDMTNYSLKTENGAGIANTPWYSLRTGITSVNIHHGITSIGEYAFSDCQNVTSVTIPKSITGIGTSAFRNCSSLKDVYYIGNETRWNGISIGSDNECLTGAEIHYGIVLESDHPCKDNTDETWSYTHPTEAVCLAVTFSEDTETPYDGEYISLIDEAGNVYSYCGSALAGKTVYLPGDSFSIRLVMYYSENCYGFAITSVAGLSETEYAEHCNTLLDSGTCGDDLTWELTGNEVLTISGTGEMTDFGGEEGEAPWYDCRYQIKMVQIEDGVTSIGDCAFNECRVLSHVDIPDSVTRIGTGAFVRTTLKELTIPDSVTSIGASAFLRSGLENIIIPQGVTMIEDDTFNFGNLKSVVIPDSVTSIGYMAFRYNFDLESITIPESVTSIAGYAFEDCHQITSVTIPGSIANMGDGIFCTCIGLRKAVISDGVTRISSGTFTSCFNLSSITIPDTVTSIGERAFLNCENLADVYFTGTEVQWNNIAIDYDNDCLMNASIHFGSTGPAGATLASGICGDNLAWELDINGILTITGTGAMADFGGEEETAWSSYRNQIISVLINDNVTSIGRGAFCGCSNLNSVNIPDSVTSIGNTAFAQCGRLTVIRIPDGVTRIGDYTFSFDSRLADITIPDSVTSIGDYAFYYCSSLAGITIPDGVTSIGQGTFANCYSLPDITIPATVTNIGKSAFISNWMTGINVSKENTVYTSEDGVLFDKEKTTLLCCPGQKSGAYIIPDGVTSIEDNAFGNCRNLTDVTIPDSVTSIEIGAFSGCSGLTEVVIPGSVTCIESFTFHGCSSLASVTVPESVTEIGNSAFFDCQALTEVNYPGTEAQWNEIVIGEDNEYLTNAEKHFYGEPIASGTCGKNLSWALDTEGVLTISGSGEMADFNPIAPWYSYRDQITTIRIENGVTSIGQNAFNVCSNLTDVSIPDSVASIGRQAFGICSSLTDVTIPEGVTSIGEYAFAQCSSLMSVTIPAGVTSIGECAFMGCTGLTGIHVNAENAYYFSEDGILFNKDKTDIVAYPGGKTGGYTIPDSITSIGDNAFVYCTGLESITIPDAVTSISRHAFSLCSNLTGIYVSNGNAIYSSEGGVLLDKEKKTILIFPGGRTGEYTVPGFITSIGDGAFANCKKLTDVTIPDNVSSIGEAVFDGCSGLTNVTIPNSVNGIPGYAFSRCGSLTNIAIPDGVTEIGELAFYLCENLESITIPSSMTVINEHAFEACRSLTDIYYSGARCQWNTITINTGNVCLTSATIHADLAHILMAHDRVDPTCTTTGTEAYWSCEICGMRFSDEAGEREIEAPAEIAVAADNHRWGEPEYIWADDKRTVTASRVCEYNAEHTDTKQTAVVCEVTAPTDTDEGLAVYTAVFEDGSYETQTRTIAIPALNALSVMQLPSGLETIEREAFSGLACQAVIIPEGCTTIGDYAFAGCSQLVYVRIPASIQGGWPENAFEGCHIDLVTDFAGAD